MSALSVIDVMDDPALLGASFRGESWSTWRAVLKAAQALPMTGDELEAFHAVAGGRDPPAHPVNELWIIAGRRAGKDSIASVLITAAAAHDYTEHIRPGEHATCMLIACDRDQSRIVYRYTEAGFRDAELLRGLVDGEPTQDSFGLVNGNEIAIHSNNFRGVRGRPVAIAVLDEVAFYRDERSASPDREVYNAIAPGTATIPGSMIVGISSPYKKAGLLYEKWRDHFGRNDDDVLVVQGASRIFNPTLSQDFIDKQLERDPVAGRAEWLAEWRDDISGFLNPDHIERAATLEDAELMPAPGVVRVGSLDPSGGRRDYMTAAIAWMDGQRVVVGALRSRRPPFDPASVTAEFAAMFKRYGLREVYSDQYAAEWVRSTFAHEGITILPSGKSASDIMLEAEPLFAQGAIDLPRHKLLLSELRNLERRTVRGGRDRVEHPVGGHDDHAVAACMAAWLARRAVTQRAIITGPRIFTAPRWSPELAGSY